MVYLYFPHVICIITSVFLALAIAAKVGARYFQKLTGGYGYP
jgi:hypothetical protein